MDTDRYRCYRMPSCHSGPCMTAQLQQHLHLSSAHEIACKTHNRTQQLCHQTYGPKGMDLKKQLNTVIHTMTAVVCLSLIHSYIRFLMHSPKAEVLLVCLVESRHQKLKKRVQLRVLKQSVEISFCFEYYIIILDCCKRLLSCSRQQLFGVQHYPCLWSVDVEHAVTLDSVPLSWAQVLYGHQAGG